MPVPVPVFSKQPAHPVIKNKSQATATDYPRTSLFQHLTNTFPLPPTGPPPSFTTREEWISSLPSWRRNKPRHIWEEGTPVRAASAPQGFKQGLTAVDNTSVIKGAPAQACIPPIATLLTSADMAATHYMDSEDYLDDEMSPEGESVTWEGANMSQWTDGEDEDMTAEGSDSGSMEYAHSAEYVGHRSYERGAFSPVFEESSPDHEHDSSPVGPSTPFDEYIDRAATTHPNAPYGSNAVGIGAVQQSQYACARDYCGAQFYQCQSYAAAEQQVHQQPPAPESIPPPTATASYRKLAEPLAEWVATFVWKACTTGMYLHSPYAQPMAYAKHYSAVPPSHLTRAIHSMLLSTLLQPSAVLLALWYIVRLPVLFGQVNTEFAKEIRFREELLGDMRFTMDRDAVESYAPFRLVILGCMLANKWLDDHTFSNKTWHTISNVPMQSLNKLESLALDLLAHDISISNSDWAHWLQKLHAHHLSLSSPAFPQPISRPSNSPHTIIRKVMESLVETTRVCHEPVEGTPEPVFLSFDDHKKDPELQQMEDVDVLEIDLDEDGPLREEYLPKRRTSNANQSLPNRSQERHVDADRALPPPARWSPSGDEPIIQPARTHAQYVAPQPIAQGHGHVTVAASLPPAPFHQALDMSRRIWPSDEQVAPRHFAPQAPVYPVQPMYVGYEYPYQHNVANHARSQSLSMNPSMVQPQGHYRSYSQSRCDMGYGDMRCGDLRYAVPVQPYAPHWSTHYDPAVYTTGFGGPFHYQRSSLKV